MTTAPVQIQGPAPTLVFAPEQTRDRPEVDALVMDAFGPGRYAKTAERVRERAHMAAGFTARDGERLIGSVRLWSIEIEATPALFLGPITVAADDRRAGTGRDLVAACIDYGRRCDIAGILLVGDLSYFTRFGFEPAPQVSLSGPADPRRVLWLPISGPAPAGLARPV
ncbi:N-acetyltransferase [soil metagenome]